MRRHDRRKPWLYKSTDPQHGGWWLCEFPGNFTVFAGPTSGHACKWLARVLSNPSNHWLSR